MRVAINGAGIAGPTLAYWLREFGHEPTLFEHAPAPRSGGYIVDFWGLGYDIAERMGALPALIERCYRMERLSMVDARGREVVSLDVAPMRAQLHGRFFSIARADLAATLLEACRGIAIRFGVSIAGIEQADDGVSVTLSDGARERFDLVVGADGLHSRVRGLLFGNGANETSLDCHVAAFRLDGYPRRDESTYVSHTVPGRQAARVALRGDETLVLLIWRSPGLTVGPSRAEQMMALHRVFGDMQWEVPDILDRMDDVEELYFDRVSQIHLPRWSAGRVALIGDAAACASLLAGEGTGLAMIEAYVLAGELHRAGGDIALALSRFEARLRGFVTAKQQAALRFRGFFAPKTALSLFVRNTLVRVLSLPVVGSQLVGRSVRDDLTLPDYRG